jgi:hypothetical protein
VWLNDDLLCLVAVVATWGYVAVCWVRAEHAREAARWARVATAAACGCDTPHVNLHPGAVPSCARCKGVIRV